MVLNENVDQNVIPTAYRQWVAAKDEQALISFHEAGFFLDLQWKRIKDNNIYKEAVDGWFQFDFSVKRIGHEQLCAPNLGESRF